MTQSTEKNRLESTVSFSNTQQQSNPELSLLKFLRKGYANPQGTLKEVIMLTELENSY
jgi:hypothetical protein